jgi:hypothetical protein
VNLVQKINTRLVTPILGIPRRLDSELLLWRVKRKLRERPDLPYTLKPMPEIAQYKQSDTMFIFGSGPSVNDLTPDELQRIRCCDTLSFNRFCYKPVVECTFHLTHDIYGEWKPLNWQFHVEKCRFYANSFFKYQRQPIHLLQGEPSGFASRMLLAESLLPPQSICSIYEERRNSRNMAILPDRSEWTLMHGRGTLIDCVHFAFLMKYSKIVLVGVDLTNTAYFFLKEGERDPDNERRGIQLADKHTTSDAMMELLPKWASVMKTAGSELFVYSKRSMLASCLPLFNWDPS